MTLKIIERKSKKSVSQWLDQELWEEYERRKSTIAEAAKDHEDYEKLNRKLIEELGI